MQGSTELKTKHTDLLFPSSFFLSYQQPELYTCFWPVKLTCLPPNERLGSASFFITESIRILFSLFAFETIGYIHYYTIIWGPIIGLPVKSLYNTTWKKCQTFSRQNKCVLAMIVCTGEYSCIFSNNIYPEDE